MSTPDDDFDALLEESLGPVGPPAGVRERILGGSRAVPARRRLARVAAPALAYALGVLTVLALPRGQTPASPPPAREVSYESIADVPPPPAPEPSEEPVEPVVQEPLPRIS